MGLDLRPMGKPKPGFEKRYVEIFDMIRKDEIPKPSFLERLKGVKYPTKEELLNEWFENQIETYETIKAPRVGRDKIADEWIATRYEKMEEKPPFDQFMNDYQGYYVIELAEEKDGVPMYASFGQDENVFRGQFLQDCTDILGKELIEEAYNSKLADDALDYGNRLMAIADELAKKNDLLYLKEQRKPPKDFDEDSLESKLHIIYSLAKWLVFYGKNGHGYEADW